MWISLQGMIGEKGKKALVSAELFRGARHQTASNYQEPWFGEGALL